MIGLAAAILGAAWRRWWGSDTQDVRYLRAVQAVTGFVVLGAVCLFAGMPWWEAALRSGAALGFLSERAWCLPIVWQGWGWLASQRLAPEWFKRRWTMFAEATAGGIVWPIALIV